MKAHERITAAIRAANEAGRTGLVPFVTAGYPEPKDFVSTLRAVAAVGDVVEARRDRYRHHRAVFRDLRDLEVDLIGRLRRVAAEQRRHRRLGLRRGKSLVGPRRGQQRPRQGRQRRECDATLQ